MGSKKRFFTDDGWAVWIDGEDTSTVYLNEWINPKGNSYVDVGVRIIGIMEAKKLSIYAPFAVDASEIEDISQKLKDRDILCAIFSTACLIDYKKNEYASEIAYHGKTVDLIHSSAAMLTAAPLSNGTLIEIPFSELHAYLDNDEVYLLFRIPHKSLDEVFRPRATVGHLWENFCEAVTTPIVSERYGYSVRINEMRVLPNEITRIGAFHRQKLQKSVVTISLNEAYELNDANCYRIHRLERKLYQNYVPAGFSCEDVITYQWNQTREENLRGHFNFYFDISYHAISRSSMLIYMFLVLLLGTAGSALWEVLKYMFGIF